MQQSQKVTIVGLRYVSLYFLRYDEAITIYTNVFGEPNYFEEPGIVGYKMGDTWLTIFPAHSGTSKESDPRNTEFAIQVSTPEEVDTLYMSLIIAGAVECMAPSDTKMYEPMRFDCVDDPFGVRIDVYCPLRESDL